MLWAITSDSYQQLNAIKFTQYIFVLVKLSLANGEVAEDVVLVADVSCSQGRGSSRKGLSLPGKGYLHYHHH